jgi:hypothetical protein
MSEYQYYEFQAVDRLLDAQAREGLRAISSRARITASSFVNSYDFGDLKADPLELLERHFDLFVYVANWGTRWFAMKVPKQAVDIDTLQIWGLDKDLVRLRPAGEHMILSISRDDVENEDWDDGTGWLASLAPLRSELLAGDHRIFSLLWLIQLENGWTKDDAVEPPPALGPLSPSLAALADFLCVDGDLLEAAAGSGAVEGPTGRAGKQSEPSPGPTEPSPADVERFVRGLSDDEKVALLLRLHAGESHLSAELRRRAAAAVATGRPIQRQATRRTAGELRAAARRLDVERDRLASEKAAAAEQRRKREAAQEREKHLATMAGREERAWADVESLIAQRNPLGYERATAILADLGEIADRKGARTGFARRVAEMRTRHARKAQFIKRLDEAGVAAE